MGAFLSRPRQLLQAPVGLFQAALQLLSARPPRPGGILHPRAGMPGPRTSFASALLPRPLLLPPFTWGRRCLSRPALGGKGATARGAEMGARLPLSTPSRRGHGAGAWQWAAGMGRLVP